MSWLKLNLISYDLTSFGKSSFILSLKDKSIKDDSLNDLIEIPFFIVGNYNLYKLEVKITNSVIKIYIYVNIKNLYYYIINSKEIPFKNELFEILKMNKNNFKFNKKTFDHLQSNILENNILEKIFIPFSCRILKNDVFSYKNLIFDTEKQQIFDKNKYHNYKNINFNNYLIFENKYNFNKLYHNLAKFNYNKTLFVYDDPVILKEIKNLYQKESILDINCNNFKNIKFELIIKNNLISISLKLIKSKKYWKKYLQHHSLGKFPYAYDNYKSSLNNLSHNISMYNVELIDYNNIYFVNCLHKDYIKNENFQNFTSLIKGNRNIFIETNYKQEFNYHFYLNFINNFHVDSNLDTNLNNSIINNNIFFYTETQSYHYNTLILKPKLNTIHNIKYKYNLCLFEYIFKNLNLQYEVCIQNIDLVCPIVYQKKDLYIKTSCNHIFSFNGFSEHLCFSNVCPICTRKLNNSKVQIIASSYSKLSEFLLGDFITKLSNSNFGIILDNSFDSDIMNRRLQKLKIKDKKILYFDWDSINKYHKNNSISLNNWYIYNNPNENVFTKKRNMGIIGSLNNIFENINLNVITVK